MNLRRYLTQKGQTSVEYLLMVAMSITLGVKCFEKFEGYLLTNPDSYINMQMKIYKEMFDPQYAYKKFRLPR
ncbi:MAG: hypothetical protein H0V66_00645 [Bdellovibrionales bacterium]|nr:hypothetical protein [Bdellovibrionales bacterium]